MKLSKRIRGCLLGGAIGDALGAPVEFLTIASIHNKYGLKGIQEFDKAYGVLGAITDDTQMTLFTNEGICQAFMSPNMPLEVLLTQSYLHWLFTQTQEYSPEFNLPGLLKHKELWAQRAPGLTCLGSLKLIQKNGRISNNNSKGCGGVMRVAPIGMAFSEPDDAYCVGKMSALITHHHLDGFIPAGALARIISQIIFQDMTLFEAQADTLQFIKKEEPDCNTVDLWDDMVKRYNNNKQFEYHNLEMLGQGWSGDEALVMSIYCALTEQDFIQAIINSVNHSGDSDSTGSITGQILGAAYGEDILPLKWVENLELNGIISEQADILHGIIINGK